MFFLWCQILFTDFYETKIRFGTHSYKLWPQKNISSLVVKDSFFSLQFKNLLILLCLAQ
jgi:hypothetical protein